MLVTMDKVLIPARKNGYGVINAVIMSDSNIVKTVQTAEEKKSPIILSFNLHTTYTSNDKDLDILTEVARYYAERASVPVVIHLDHGRDYDEVLRALHRGFTSVMIDASSLPYEENVKRTSEVVEISHDLGVPVEAELGCVGMADEGFKLDGKYSQNVYTDPELVEDYIKKTNVDSLAISIGNAHGPYAKNIIPHIEFGILKEITDRTDIPLVLHGGSGTGDEQMTRAAQNGIAKFNIGTDLYGQGMEWAMKLVEENDKKAVIDFLPTFDNGYAEKLAHYIDVLGSTGKAL